MNCALNYCIYNKDHVCILNEIEIDSLGMCESCELVSVPEERIDEECIEIYKSKRLDQIEGLNKQK